MLFTIEKEKLLQLLYLTNSIVERKNTMPILANVKMTAEDGLLQVWATDLEVSLVGDAQAEVSRAGSIAVDAKVLYEIVRELPDSKVTAQVTKSNRLEIESGQARFKINGTSADEYPSVMGVQLNDPISVDAGKLTEMMEKTIFAVSTDETRFNINGVYVEALENESGKQLRFVATDGHRLAAIDRPADGLEFKNSVIIPRKGISELRKLLDGNEGVAQVGINEGFFTVSSENVTLGIRLVDGQFPDYKQVIPTSVKTTISVDRNTLLSAVKRVSLVTTDKSKALKFSLSDSNLHISSSSPEYGEASDNLTVDQKGDNVTIGFSSRYLIDILNAMNGVEKITIRFNGEVAPGLFLGNEDESYRCVVMPMRFE